MPYPLFKDANAAIRSVATVNVNAAGTNADPDINRTGSLDGDLVTVGAVADVAPAAGAAGTVNAKLRLMTSQLATVAQDGTDATGAAAPTGGVGVRGWLSGIYTRLAGVVLATGTAVVGKVGIDQTTPGTTNGVAVLAQIGAANLSTNQVTVDTTTGGVVVAAARATRRTLTVVNHGTTPVFLGTGTVSAANGVMLAGVVGASASFGVTGAVKAVVAGGTQVVSFSEEYD